MNKQTYVAQENWISIMAWTTHAMRQLC